jgi:hypothetical protein
MLAILEPLKAMESKVVFEGQKRHTALSNTAMLTLLRRMEEDGVTVHGFRSTSRATTIFSQGVLPCRLLTERLR